MYKNMYLCVHIQASKYGRCKSLLESVVTVHLKSLPYDTWIKFEPECPAMGKYVFYCADYALVLVSLLISLWESTTIAQQCFE